LMEYDSCGFSSAAGHQAMAQDSAFRPAFRCEHFQAVATSLRYFFCIKGDLGSGGTSGTEVKANLVGRGSWRTAHPGVRNSLGAHEAEGTQLEIGEARA